MRISGLCVAVAGACLIVPLQATAQSLPTPDQSKAAYATANPERLIDELTSIDCPFPGASDTGTFGGFLAEETSMEPSATVLYEQNGRLHLPVSCRPDSVQNIVLMGPAALPALLRHLGDKRSTKLTVGMDPGLETVGGRFLANEYETRRLTWTSPGCVTDALCEKRMPFDKPYTVKIGDVCFVLIGQIVNREWNAVRYQPTAIVMVNSPIEMPELEKWVRADWAGIDDTGVKNSLLDDLHTTKLADVADADTESQLLERIHSGALVRLRYYFPETYASLTGSDLEKREAFERAEREHVQK